MAQSNGEVKRISPQQFAEKFKLYPYSYPWAPITSAQFLEWEKQFRLHFNSFKQLVELDFSSFWSVLIFKNNFFAQFIRPILNDAPRFFNNQQNNSFEIPLYSKLKDLHLTFFKRLAVRVESKENFLDAQTYGAYICKTIELEDLLNFCSLFDAFLERESELKEIIEVITSHNQNIILHLHRFIPVFLEEIEKRSRDLDDAIKTSRVFEHWDLKIYDTLLQQSLQQVVSFSRFIQFSAKYTHQLLFSYLLQLTMLIAMSYEKDIENWSLIVLNFPEFEDNFEFYRDYTIKLFRSALEFTTIKSESKSKDGVSPEVDQFFEVITNCLEMELFVNDYEENYPFLQDIETLRLKRGITIDKDRMEYISNGIKACSANLRHRIQVSEYAKEYNNGFNEVQELGACSLEILSDDPLELKIKEVKEMLPEIDRDRILALLKHYKNNTAELVNAVFENTAPEFGSLTNSESKDKSQIPLSSFKMQKEEMEAKEDVNSFKQRVLEEYNEIEYNDDYEDYYEGYNAKAEREESVQPLNEKTGRRKYYGPDDDESDEESGARRDNFVEDPAVLRERYERKRQAKIENRGGGGGFNQNKNRDVVGKAKGQGQEKDVVLNRRHKDQQGSHNRRKGADYKRREF